MEILFGDDAPTLEEQGLDLFIDCHTHQRQLDSYLEALDSGEISIEEFEKRLEALALSISQQVDAVLAEASEECTLFFDTLGTIH